MHHAQKMHRAHTGEPTNFREASRAGSNDRLREAFPAPSPEYAPRRHGSARQLLRSIACWRQQYCVRCQSCPEYALRQHGSAR